MIKFPFLPSCKIFFFFFKAHGFFLLLISFNRFLLGMFFMSPFLWHIYSEQRIALIFNQLAIKKRKEVIGRVFFFLVSMKSFKTFFLMFFFLGKVFSLNKWWIVDEDLLLLLTMGLSIETFLFNIEGNEDFIRFILLHRSLCLTYPFIDFYVIWIDFNLCFVCYLQ